MPRKAPRICNKPGCRGVVENNVCTVCGPKRTYGWKHSETSTQRGYGIDWQKVREMFVRRKVAEAILEGRSWPVCALCGQEVHEREMHVDHVRPFIGLQDPLRLDIENLRICHFKCHMQRTAVQAHGSRV